MLHTSPTGDLLIRHDCWSPTQPTLLARHDHGHQVTHGHDHVMTCRHELKTRDLKPLNCYPKIGI
jgi:hypothetical protein